MNATFATTGGGDPIAHIRLAADASKATRADLLFGGNLLIGIIRDRTFGGVDVDGTPFEPYKPAYAEKKAAALGPGLVNLFSAEHHTHMLNALQVVVDSDNSFGVGIYTNDELETRARVHNKGLTVRTRLGSGKGKPRKGAKASFAMPRRRWLDAHQSEVEQINKAMGDRIDARLKELS